MNENLVHKMKYPEYNLDKRDQEIILKNGCLTDIHIGRAQALLKMQYPNIQGLQSTTLGIVGQFDVVHGEFVQILHTGSYHWVCVSNIGLQKPNVVNIYDSKYTGVKMFTKKQIASLLYTASDEITVQVQPVTQQSNGVDCGVYSIAFAVAGERDRNHLWHCLHNERIEMFPTTMVSKSLTDSPGPIANVKLKIYCTCRLPYSSKDDMVECVSCSKWYHKDCQQVPDRVFRRKNMLWKCSLCI